MKKILLISHDASRTGAPILLLNLAKILQKTPNVIITILLKNGGVMIPEFKTLGHVTIIHDGNQISKYNILGRMRRRMFVKKLANNIKQFDLVLSNTITNGDLHFMLKKHPRVLTYVHELSSVIHATTTSETLSNVISHTNLFLYPSKAVFHNLVNNLGISSDKCLRLNYYIPDKLEFFASKRKEIRNSLNIQPYEKLIVGSGTCDWRKGTDLFIQTILLLQKTDLPVRAIWVGGNIQSKDYRQVQFDIEKAGLQSIVTITGSVVDPHYYMAAADVFYLSSREDPYPLVILEAAMMKLPIVCFLESGGASEFISQNKNLCASYLRIDEMAKIILELLLDDKTATEYSLANRVKYLDSHSFDVISNKILSIISDKK